MTAQVAADLRAAAEVLRTHWDVAYDAICDSRDMAARVADDRDSVDVLRDLCDALEAAADAAEATS